MTSVFRMQTGRSLVFAAIAFVSVGCSFGPEAFRGGSAGYNIAAQRSAAEQLLLNIVRLKYREPIMFLQVASITAHYDASVSAAGSGSFPAGSPDSLGASVGAGYSESPTLSYTPLDGSEFANRILKETDMSTVALLVRGGWDLKDLMRIGMQRIGSLDNYPAPGTGPYAGFMKVVELWGRMQRRGDWALVKKPGSPMVIADRIPAEQVDLGAWMNAGESGYTLQRREDGDYRLLQDTAGGLALRLRFTDVKEADYSDDLLGIAPDREKKDDGTVIEMIDLVGTDRSDSGKEDGTLPVQLRCFSDMLYYVAQGVQIPASHEERGLVKVYRGRGADEPPVDRRGMTRDLLDVRYSPVIPGNAFVSVNYRGGWYYIDDADVASKDAFALLNLIYSLLSSEKKALPTLTIPVTG